MVLICYHIRTKFEFRQSAPLHAHREAIGLRITQSQQLSCVLIDA